MIDLPSAGFTHPVEDLYLEDVLRIVDAPSANGGRQNGQHPAKRMQAAYQGRSGGRPQVHLHGPADMATESPGSAKPIGKH